MKRSVLFAVAVTILCAVSTSSFAKVEIRPFMKVKEEFDDNIFLDKNNREHDFITDINPSLLISYSPRDDLDMGLHYGFSFRFYERNSQLNTSSMTESQSIRFQTKFRPTNRLTIDVTDIYTREPINDQLNATPENPFENKTAVNIFRISPYAVFPITSTLSTQIGYRYSNVWHDEEVSNNKESHSAYASLMKVFSYGLSVSASYDYAPVRSDLSGNRDRHDVSLNASYQINQKFRIWGGYGTAFIKADDNQVNTKVVDPFTGAIIPGRYFERINDKNESFWSAGASYTMDIFGGTEVKASYDESFSEQSITQEQWREGFKYLPIAFIEDSLVVKLVPMGEYIFDSSSTTAGLTKIRKFDVLISAGEHVKVLINPSYKKEESLEDNIVFVPTGSTPTLNLSSEEETMGIYFRVEKPIKLYGRAGDVSFGGGYDRQEFSQSGFKDEFDVYSLGTNMSVSLSKRIFLSGGYRFRDKNSDDGQNDYYSNIVWIEAEVTF